MMNKNILLGIGGLVILGGVWFMTQTPQNDMGQMMEKKEEGAMMEKTGEKMGGDHMMEDGKMMDGEKMMEKPTSTSLMEKKEEAAMMQKGSYEAYAASKLAMAEKGKVVLFFRASWCPTCRSLDGNIKANSSEIPGGVAILDVNYDTATELKQKYGVTYQHTLVQVDQSGNQITKWQGSPSLADIISRLK